MLIILLPLLLIVPGDRSGLLRVIPPLAGIIDPLPSKTSSLHVYILLALPYPRYVVERLRLPSALHFGLTLHLLALLYRTCSNSWDSGKGHWLIRIRLLGKQDGTMLRTPSTNDPSRIVFALCIRHMVLIPPIYPQGDY
jgi:hypothetical protein